MLGSPSQSIQVLSSHIKYTYGHIDLISVTYNQYCPDVSLLCECHISLLSSKLNLKIHKEETSKRPDSIMQLEKIQSRPFSGGCIRSLTFVTNRSPESFDIRVCLDIGRTHVYIQLPNLDIICT